MTKVKAKSAKSAKSAKKPGTTAKKPKKPKEPKEPKTVKKDIYAVPSKEHPMEVNQEQLINVPGFIWAALDKYGAKKLLMVIKAVAIQTSFDKISPPSSFLATDKDVENIDAAIKIKYVLDKWDELCEPSEQHWKEQRELADKKRLKKEKEND